MRGTTPRGTARRRASLPVHHKRAMKRATMRDCGRRCVYCASPLEIELVALALEVGRVHRRRPHFLGRGVEAGHKGTVGFERSGQLTHQLPPEPADGEREQEAG